MYQKLTTLFTGQHRIHKQEVTSTNTEAQLILSKSKPPEGTAISAAYQSEGRGQIGRYWYGSAGLNVMISMIFYPSWIKPSNQFQLNMAISCAVMHLISDHLKKEKVCIKWPNDIYVDDEKIAGILIQNTISGATISSTIVGVGININEQQFPSALPNPTSLANLLGKDVDVEVIYGQLFALVEKYYLQLKSDRGEAIKSEYIHNLFGRDRARTYSLESGETIEAIVQHVDDTGKIVMLVNGKERSFSFREVRLLQSESET